MFVNRERELVALEEWWDDPSAHLGLLWGRRRVGKTSLLQRFAVGRRAVFHTAAGRTVSEELRLLALAAAPASTGRRDLSRRPFADWDDAAESLAEEATDERLLVVIDEFPELVRVSPELPGVLRALLDRLGDRRLKLLLCGSAVSVMEAIQTERAPLYGRVDLRLLLHPFEPHECAPLLADLPPAERAQVWVLLDGMPLYLTWWDQQADVRTNVERLFTRPDGRLLAEGQLVLTTEADAGDLASRVLHAIAAGRTRFSEITDVVRADPTRTLDRLVELRLVERLVPVTEDPRRTRRRLYRLADNFLAFWLTVVDRYRGEIERGLGASVLPVILDQLDEFAGPRWEDAFRRHLRRLAAAGRLGEGVVAVGPFWRDGADPVEIDAVVLAGRSRRATLVGEAKWARRVDGRRVARQLHAKSLHLPERADDLRLAICARDQVEHADEDVLTVTAEDIFTP